MVAAALRSVFVQQEATAVAAQWDQVITMLTEKFPAAAALIGRSQGRCPGIPILSTGALAQDLEHQPPGEAQLRTERGAPLLPIKRRTRVVGIFPNDAAVIRLVGPCCCYGSSGQQGRETQLALQFVPNGRSWCRLRKS
jgi:hypothetical protein